MTADSATAHRRVRCPKCKGEIVIPDLLGAVLSDPNDSSSFAIDAPTSQDSTIVEQPFDVNGVDDFELVADVPGRFEPPAPDPDDPMLRLFPDFIPNPFQISYPLDETVDEDDLEDEEQDFVDSKMPSVDELISGQPEGETDL